MEFKLSPKNFCKYKSEHPQKTVKEIKKLLKKERIRIRYKEDRVDVGDFSVYIGRAFYKKDGKEEIISTGKGISKNLCRASTYGELLERWLSGYTFLPNIGKNNNNKNNFKKIKVKKFFQNFCLSKYSTKSKKWILSQSFLENKKVLLPISLIEKISGGNGLAAGNTTEEAVSQAFCEVFERYSLIKHIREKIPAKTVEQKSIKNKKIKLFIDFFNSFGIDVEIKNMTIDNSLPVMGVLFTDNKVKDDCAVIKNIYHKVLYVGAHIDLEEAIIRCFTEKLQGFHYPQIKPGRIYSVERFPEAVDVLNNFYNKKENKKIINGLKKTKHITSITRQKSIENYNFFSKKKISFSLLRSVKTEDFLEDINIIKNILKENKWDAFVVDYSKKNCFVCVVRVIIPSISDWLMYAFPKNKKFESIEELLSVYLKLMEDVFEEKNDYKIMTYNNLKYDLLPKSIIPWGRNYPSPVDIFNVMFKKAEEEKNKEEVKKIERIKETIIGQYRTL